MSSHWKPHKTTLQRKREAESPPPLRDTLDDPATGRFLTELATQLNTARAAFSGHGYEVSLDLFAFYLAKQHGTLGGLPGSEKVLSRHGGNGDVLGEHVFDAATNPDTLSDLLDYFGQYLWCEMRNFQRGVQYYSPSVQATEVAVGSAVNAINRVLAHDACIFRIVPDSTHGFAVNSIVSEAMRTEAIEPALRLLRDENFKVPLQEYELALVAFAKGERRDAVRQASHALESTIKQILTAAKLPYDEHAQPSKLIALLSSNALLPARYQNLWTNFEQMIQGVITVRNKEPGAGHGPGPDDDEPDTTTAEYAINMAAANILFMIKSWKDASS